MNFKITNTVTCLKDREFLKIKYYIVINGKSFKDEDEVYDVFYENYTSNINNKLDLEIIFNDSLEIEETKENVNHNPIIIKEDELFLSKSKVTPDLKDLKDENKNLKDEVNSLDISLKSIDENFKRYKKHYSYYSNQGYEIKLKYDRYLAIDKLCELVPEYKMTEEERKFFNEFDSKADDFKYFLKRRENEFLIDPDGVIRKMDIKDYKEEIAFSLHYKIAKSFFPQSNNPLDTALRLNWIVIGSHIGQRSAEKTPTSKQFKTMKEKIGIVTWRVNGEFIKI